MEYHLVVATIDNEVFNDDTRTTTQLAALHALVDKPYPLLLLQLQQM